MCEDAVRELVDVVGHGSTLLDATRQGDLNRLREFGDAVLYCANVNELCWEANLGGHLSTLQYLAGFAHAWRQRRMRQLAARLGHVHIVSWLDGVHSDVPF